MFERMIIAPIAFVGEVLVAKMPCLYPGDFRKLNAVNVPKLQECLRDCVVFPSKGPRPHPSEMSGSDLDGDKYWVSSLVTTCSIFSNYQVNHPQFHSLSCCRFIGVNDFESSKWTNPYRMNLHRNKFFHA